MIFDFCNNLQEFHSHSLPSKQWRRHCAQSLGATTNSRSFSFEDGTMAWGNSHGQTTETAATVAGDASHWFGSAREDAAAANSTVTGTFRRLYTYPTCCQYCNSSFYCCSGKCRFLIMMDFWMDKINIFLKWVSACGGCNVVELFKLYWKFDHLMFTCS